MRHQLPLMLLFAACTSSSSQDTKDVSSALEQANGGYDTTDEAPMFADDQAFATAAIEADATASDSLASDPTLQGMDTSAAVSAHNVIVVWGKIPADHNGTVRDWSGTLALSRGGLLVRRTIAFEDKTDKLLPRPDIHTVAFQSVTKPYVDGLALTVLDPTPAATDALTLTYTATTGGATYAFDLAQLESGPIVIDAGDGFKMVAIAQHRVAGCEGGFMRGRWHQLLPHLGVYLGVVTDRDGTPVGHVRGIYGQRKNGDDVMFGKFIDVEGHFKGLLAGTYASGDFKAHWLDRAGDHGRIRGKYFEGATATGGQFVARWAETSCAQDQ